PPPKVQPVPWLVNAVPAAGVRAPAEEKMRPTTCAPACDGVRFPVVTASVPVPGALWKTSAAVSKAEVARFLTSTTAIARESADAGEKVTVTGVDPAAWSSAVKANRRWLFVVSIGVCPRAVYVPPFVSAHVAVGGVPADEQVAKTTIEIGR